MVIKKHFNKPQLRSMAIDAPYEILLAGRGVGKTQGVLSRKTADRYFGTMPRSTGVALAATFTQLTTATLPELLNGFQQLGYNIDEHFVFGRRPPDKWIKRWKWKQPYTPVLDYKYVTVWWNGAIMKPVAQTRPPNGTSIDWIIGDELKLINQEKLNRELLPANRGIKPAFAGNIYHHGQTYTTDMPVGTGGRWIFEMEKMMDREKVNQIWNIQVVRFRLIEKLKIETRETFKKEYKKQIAILDEEMNDLRRELLYFHEANTLDNIHALGSDYIKRLLRDNTPFEFDTQVLNIRPLRLEDGFYPDFDEEVHGYFSEHEEYFNNLEYDPFNVTLDCRKDKDLDSNAPLHIGMDYNRRIWPITTGQVNKTELKTISGIHVLYPQKLKDAVQKWCDYYRPHKRKLVYYWYDQTAVGDMYETRMCDDVVEVLRKNGWTVIEMYIGLQPGHEERYRMWGDLLTNSGKYDKTYRTNRENCDKLILSINQAQAEQRKDGFGKNKKSEKDPKFPAEESTHYTDANDTWVFGVLESGQYKGYEEQGDGGMIM